MALSDHMHRYAGKLWFPRNRGTNMTENAHFRIEKACRGYPLRLGTFSTFGSWRPSGFCSPYNQSFPGIADLWAVKALVWTTKPTGSPTPESRKSIPPKRVPAACLFYTEMCIFGHICPPISRKPEFFRHSGACGLRVPPFYCKTH